MLGLVDNATSEQITLKALKSNLKEALRKSGVLDNVKAQIRKEFISGLSAASTKSPLLHQEEMGIKDRIVLSTLYHHLKSRLLEHTVSVFVAECGIDAKSFILSEEDVIQSLNLSQLEQLQSRQTDQPNMLSASNEEKDGGCKRSCVSLLELIINDMTRRMRKCSMETSCQTDSTIGGDGLGPREYLESQIRQLKQSYLSKREAEAMAPNRTVEERMILFQRECEERFRRDLELQVSYVRESEISKVRLEESHRARLELESLRKEMEADYQHRMHVHAEREAESIRRTSERERQIQQTEYEARQKIQRELDDVRSREQAGHRKTELESQGLHMLELRLKEVQAVLDGREREVARRERDIENKSRDCEAKAKAEARATLQAEVEATMRDRMALKLDRQRMADKHASHAALLASAENARKMLRDAHAALFAKDDELDALRMRVEAMMRHEAEMSHALDLLAASSGADSAAVVSGETSSAAQGHSQSQVHELVKRIAELESERSGTATTGHTHVHALSDERTKELEKLQVAYSESVSRAESIEKATAKEIDKLKRDVHSRRAKESALQLRCDELTRLLKDERATIASFQQQQQRRDLRSASAGASGRHFRDAAAVGKRTGALDATLTAGSRRSRDQGGSGSGSGPSLAVGMGSKLGSVGLYGGGVGANEALRYSIDESGMASWLPMRVGPSVESQEAVETMLTEVHRGGGTAPWLYTHDGQRYSHQAPLPMSAYQQQQQLNLPQSNYVGAMAAFPSTPFLSQVMPPQAALPVAIPPPTSTEAGPHAVPTLAPPQVTMGEFMYPQHGRDIERQGRKDTEQHDPIQERNRSGVNVDTSEEEDIRRKAELERKRKMRLAEEERIRAQEEEEEEAKTKWAAEIERKRRLRQLEADRIHAEEEEQEELRKASLEAERRRKLRLAAEQKAREDEEEEERQRSAAEAERRRRQRLEDDERTRADAEKEEEQLRRDMENAEQRRKHRVIYVERTGVDVEDADSELRRSAIPAATTAAVAVVAAAAAAPEAPRVILSAQAGRAVEEEEEEEKRVASERIRVEAVAGAATARIREKEEEDKREEDRRRAEDENLHQMKLAEIERVREEEELTQSAAAAAAAAAEARRQEEEEDKERLAATRKHEEGEEARRRQLQKEEDEENEARATAQQEAESKAAAQKKIEDDAAAIQEARNKVLQRRKQKQMREEEIFATPAPTPAAAPAAAAPPSIINRTVSEPAPKASSNSDIEESFEVQSVDSANRSDDNDWF